MSYTTIFFDLDDTLYPATTGLWAAIRARIDLYMTEFIGVDAEVVPEMRQRLWRTYGTTLRGLQNLYDINPEHYLAFVHDVPLKEYILPNPQLARMLAALPHRKIIFTNADVAHAQRVLGVLGVQEHFEKIIDVIAIQPFCKPMPEAFEVALNLAGAKPAECILVEDMPHNLAPAQNLGFYTVLVGKEQVNHPFNAVIPSIMELGQAMPVEIL